jgi:hypothetical protein
MVGFVRLPLQRNIQQGFKKLVDIHGGPVFWGSGLEKFHCTSKIQLTHKGFILFLRDTKNPRPTLPPRARCPTPSQISGGWCGNRTP